MTHKRYYFSYSDDFTKTKNQNYQLPDNFIWVKTDLLHRILSKILYFFLLVTGIIYCKLFLKLKIKNRVLLKKANNEGCFIYGNHTQPFGDVVLPALASFPKRIYTLATPANLTLPVIGKLLPTIGAIPTPKSIKQLNKMSQAIELRLKQKNHIVIYPEAHVWSYCTFIRPYNETAFMYPSKQNSPVFCMTSTYQKRKHSNQPRLTLYIDGPFYPDTNLSTKENAIKLRDTVYNCMKERSKNSSFNYIEYISIDKQ